MSSTNLTDKLFSEALRNAPAGSIICLEDVDTMFDSLDEAGNTAVTGMRRQMRKNSTLSFSGLLNAIDGLASQEGCILVMTTNHPEKLDPAFIREGRIDVSIEIKNASREQLKNMFLRFYPEEDTAANAFSVALPGEVISMAKLQNFFVSANFCLFFNGKFNVS
jgi:chaperone BCS1